MCLVSTRSVPPRLRDRVALRLRSRFVILACALALSIAAPSLARAEGMDPELSRLRLPPGKGGCPVLSAFCPDQEAFERLVSDLGVSQAPAVGNGAASLGVRGFSLRLTSSITPISGDHWTRGSAGPNAAAGAFNPSPSGALAWNRLEVRKGLPFGFEVGGAFGQGIDTSLWVFSGELRVALFEGFRSGLGALPDVAVRGAYQSMLGSRELSLQTLAFDVTLSKPYVVAGGHQLTPLIALQALFANATTKPIDFTPDVSAWEDSSDAENTQRFANVHQTRIRLFLGLEERYGPLSGALTFGFDLVVPERSANTTNDGNDDGLTRTLTLHFALGLRY